MIFAANLSSLEQIEPCHVLQTIGYYFIALWVVGTLLNGSTLYVLITNRSLRSSSTNIFIGGLIFADFLGACFEIPLPALSLISCKWIFTRAACVFEAMISYFAGCSNMYIIALISIDRYMVVTKSFARLHFTAKRAHLSIFCALTLAALWTIMPLLGWSAYDYEGIGVSCSIKWEERTWNVISYNMAILLFVYLVPVVIIVMTNVKVCLFTRRYCRCSTLHLEESRTRRKLMIERRVLYTVILIVGGFFLAWTPYAIVVSIRVFTDARNFPPIMSTLPALFAKTAVVWNPLIYAVRNRNIRKNSLVRTGV